MGDPVLHLLAGPNGAGKSTFYQEILGPSTGLPFVNADEIASRRWPGTEIEHAYQASQVAAEERQRLIDRRESFVTETVFSHPSKVQLVDQAKQAGYLVTLHIVMVPEALAVARVEQRVQAGGHDVPEDKIRGRYARLWTHLSNAVPNVDEAILYDNSRAHRPYRQVALFSDGQLVGQADWPAWAPDQLRRGRPRRILS